MQRIEAGTSYRAENTYASRFTRIRISIGERIDAYTHAVSNEARGQLAHVLVAIEGSPLADSVESLRPRIDRGLNVLDRRAVVGNLIVTAIKTTFGAGMLDAAVGMWRANNSANERQASVLGGLIGLGVIAWGVTGLRNVGSSEKWALTERSEQLRDYYRTQAGQRAALGMGTGDRESLTTQVDHIIRRMTLGEVRRVSGMA